MNVSLNAKLQAYVAAMQKIEPTQLAQPRSQAIDDAVYAANPRILHCSKTGQPVQTLSRAQWEQMLQLHGAERAEMLLAKQAAHTIAHHWIDTSPEALEKLQAIDPHGYAIYCINIIFRCYNPSSAASARFADIADAEKAAWAAQLATAYDHLFRAYSPSQLTETNELLRRYCAVLWGSAAFGIAPFTFTRPLDIVRNLPTLAEDIRRAFRIVLEFAAKRGLINPIGISYAETLDFKRIFNGASQMRMQKRPKANNSIEASLEELEAALEEFGIKSAYERERSFRLANNAEAIAARNAIQHTNPAQTVKQAEINSKPANLSGIAAALLRKKETTNA